MRALSLRQANACENAQHPTCRCRCGGKAHGAARAKAAGGLQEEAEPTETTPRDWFEQLPPDDPHHLPDAKEQKAKRRQQKQDRKAQVQGAASGGLSLLPNEDL